MSSAVGIFIISKKTNNFLLLHRSKHPIVWSILTGKIDGDENPFETIKREIFEETGLTQVYNIKKIGEDTVSGRTFHLFVGYVDDDIDLPNLKVDENNNYGWFSEENLPTPIHSKWDKTYGIYNGYFEDIKKMKRLWRV
jgi:8-oxo-dGTP pyrophosphatase MutT (NUDIX family)